jgi:hypothetical protein
MGNMLPQQTHANPLEQLCFGANMPNIFPNENFLLGMKRYRPEDLLINNFLGNNLLNNMILQNYLRNVNGWK